METRGAVWGFAGMALATQSAAGAVDMAVASLSFSSHKNTMEATLIHELVLDVNEGEKGTVISDVHRIETSLSDQLRTFFPEEADESRRKQLEAMYPAVRAFDQVRDLLSFGAYRPTDDQISQGLILTCDALDLLHPDELNDLEMRLGLMLNDPLDRIQAAWVLTMQTFAEIRTAAEALHQDGHRQDLATVFSEMFQKHLTDILARDF